MSAAEFEQLDETEVVQILSWRFDVLHHAGYGWDEALTLASHVEADLHLAAELLRRGCPPETALRILL